jgi:DNA-binding beta-propeller fold protein YncE
LDRQRRSTRRKIILIALLLLLLALLGGVYWYYARTKSLKITFAPTTADAIPVPTYLYSIGGSGTNRLYLPIGVAIAGDKLFVTDALLNNIAVFTKDGKFVMFFKQNKIHRIEYVTVNPVNGNLYVTDRGNKSLDIFSQSGKYLGVFDPHLPKNQQPTDSTGGVQWDPTNVAFAPDGTMYAIEVLRGHRVLEFDKSGKFVKSVGTAGFVEHNNESPGVFQFPNGIVVHKDLVYVADSNNRRVQVFDRDLNFKQFIPTGGLPRGIDFFNRVGVFASGKDKFVISDTLSHDGTIYTATGDQVVLFGEQGVLEGQFQFPNQVVVDTNNRIFMTDTQNSRVQVWGWPATVLPNPVKIAKQYWWICLAPLLLLPLLFLFRKRKLLVTPDFVFELINRDLLDSMPHRRWRWLAMQWDYETVKDIKHGDIDVGELIEPTEYSDSDMRALKERLEVSEEIAATLTVAQRMYVFCTEDPELRRLAKSLDVDVVNVDEYLERFGSKDHGDIQPPLGTSSDESGEAPEIASAPRSADEPRDSESHEGGE